MTDNLENNLDRTLHHYAQAFASKIYATENEDSDVLMDIFRITPELKRENRQYWGRELGMCWERLVIDLCASTRDDYLPALRIDRDEPCDLIIGNYAIDAKYRIGSGDSGTLKKFRAYGPRLRGLGFIPVLLILREDSLPAALKACKNGEWEIYQGHESFEFLKAQTGKDLYGYLEERAMMFDVAADRNLT